MDESLHSAASGASDLLPDGTAIFASTARVPRLWYAAATVGCFTSGVLFLNSVAVPADGGGARGGMLGAAFVVLAATLALLVAWRRRDQALYLAQRSRGDWHHGLIVFPNGDIVLRFHRLWGHVDRTIEAVSLSRFEVERGCAPHACGFRAYLRLHFIAADGRAQAISICQTELADDVHGVQEYLVALKERQLAF